MKYYIFLIALLFPIFLKAQSGYQYNGATGRYEYNTDPLGGIAQRYENYTNMQIGTLQRLNNNLQAINQIDALNNTNNFNTEINATMLLGKSKIAAGKAINFFKWEYDEKEGITKQQKNNAIALQQLMMKQDLDINNYCEVKAYFNVTYYLLYSGIKESSIEYIKAEAKRTNNSYLTNEYVQGMNDVQKTTNILYDIAVLEKIQKANPASNQGKDLAAEALRNRGFAHPSELILSNKGLLNKGEEKIKAGTAKTTFNRKQENLYVKSLLLDGKINNEQATKYKVYMQDFDRLIKKLNGPNNDHAFAQALLFSIYYTVYNDGKQLNAKQFEWVVNEFFKDLITDINMQASSDEKLQLLFEKLVIECMELSDKYAVAKYQTQKTTEKLKDKNQDPLALMGEIMTNRGYDDQKNLKQTAYLKIKEYFQPRNYDDYVLTNDGFVKK